MIKINGLCKSFGVFHALNHLDLHVSRGSIYGLIGVNGSGKTTLIRHLTGILKPDEGEITIDGETVYENPQIKCRIGYIPDDLYFFASYTLKEAARFYSAVFPRWDATRYAEMIRRFDINETRKINRLSKGMQKQTAFVLNMCASPDCLILDEPIDGLDPVARRLVWNYVVEDVAERNMTVLISSHNLREMEGICDSIGILSRGSMLIERDLDELKSDIHKIQVAFRNTPKDFPCSLNILHRETRGSVELLIIRERKERIESTLRPLQPVLFDILPLSLEEIFIYELGGDNSEIQSILF